MTTLNIDFSLLTAMGNLEAALTSRAVAESKTEQEIVKAEREICLTSRHLYREYVQIGAWAGVNEEEQRAVGTFLKRASESVIHDKGCIEAVNRRVKAFAKFRPLRTRPVLV